MQRLWSHGRKGPKVVPEAKKWPRAQTWCRLLSETLAGVLAWPNSRRELSGGTTGTRFLELQYDMAMPLNRTLHVTHTTRHQNMYSATRTTLVKKHGISIKKIKLTGSLFSFALLFFMHNQKRTDDLLARRHPAAYRSLTLGRPRPRWQTYSYPQRRECGEAKSAHLRHS